MGLFNRHNCCVSCTLDLLKSYNLSLIAIFLFQSFLVITVTIVETDMFKKTILVLNTKHCAAGEVIVLFSVYYS